MKETILRTSQALKDNGFDVKIFESSSAAKEHLLTQIPEGLDVGIGGSMTVYDMAIHEDLEHRGETIYWHWLVQPEARDEIRMKASSTPVYITSTNAITENGKLVNIDGVGNRVASMFYGHQDVFVIAGINKITRDTDSAINRIKEVACPQNAERLNLNTPCRHTKKCHDCRSVDRMCNVTVVLDKNPMKTKIHIYLVNEVLGY